MAKALAVALLVATVLVCAASVSASSVREESARHREQGEAHAQHARIRHQVRRHDDDDDDDNSEAFDRDDRSDDQDTNDSDDEDDNDNSESDEEEDEREETHPARRRRKRENRDRDEAPRRKVKGNRRHRAVRHEDDKPRRRRHPSVHYEGHYERVKDMEMDEKPRKRRSDFVLHPTKGLDQNSDVSLDAFGQAGGQPAINNTEIDREVGGQLIHGHLFRLDNPFGHFSILPPLNGCPGMIKPSVTAKAAKCIVATNAGFFDENTGRCFGNVISEGHVVQMDGGENACFGIRKDGNYIVGYVDESMLKSNDLPFFELVSGVVWLVRNGTRYVDESAKVEKPTMDFIREKAPRTAIGHDADGRMLLIQIDGDENIRGGVNLYDLADLLIHYGAVNAVNLDGGGSSVTVYKGDVVSQPSDNCPRTPGKCERPVGTITCIR